jgi:hypothetical protein
MNIQFGNFLETVITELLRRNKNIEIITAYSGNKRNAFKLSRDSERLIDDYITDCQTRGYSDSEVVTEYDKLINKIKTNESNLQLETNTFSHDVDILFKTINDGIYYYVEVKYNDDHDTGKFVDINRKLLKTYAYLQRELGSEITLKPILFYFNNKRMKGNIYLPEDKCIYRGKRFFDEFTDIGYDELDACMKNISENPETIKIFDDLYNKIVKQN